MAWIESHQALGHHPKTVRLAHELGVRIPEAIGCLHLLWWWALDYAPEGVVPVDDTALVARACLWHGKPERFWLALVNAGFVDDTAGTLRIHDWMDYAGRLIQKRQANVARSKRARDAHGTHNEREANAHVTGLPTNQPTGAAIKAAPLPTNPQTPLQTSPSALGSAGADGPAARAADVAVVHPEAASCPICRLPFTGSYLEHTAAKHRVNSEAVPGNLGQALGRHQPSAPPPEVAAQFEAMHERLQSIPESPQ